MSKVKNKHRQTKKMKKDNLKLQAQQGSWFHDRTIHTALIMSVAMILVPFINCFLNSYGGKQVPFLQENISKSLNAETIWNQSPSVVTYGPNSPVEQLGTEQLGTVTDF